MRTPAERLGAGLKMQQEDWHETAWDRAMA
jgi:hypothetical protein